MRRARPARARRSRRARPARPAAGVRREKPWRAAHRRGAVRQQTGSPGAALSANSQAALRRGPGSSRLLALHPPTEGAVMAFRPRHLVAAGTMAGALILGGATWASAQDEPSTTDDSTSEDSTTTTESDGRSEDTRSDDRRSDDTQSGDRTTEESQGSREGCPHGDDQGDSDNSSDSDADAEASVFAS